MRSKLMNPFKAGDVLVSICTSSACKSVLVVSVDEDTGNCILQVIEPRPENTQLYVTDRYVINYTTLIDYYKVCNVTKAKRDLFNIINGAE